MPITTARLPQRRNGRKCRRALAHRPGAPGDRREPRRRASRGRSCRAVGFGKPRRNKSRCPADRVGMRTLARARPYVNLPSAMLFDPDLLEPDRARRLTRAQYDAIVAAGLFGDDRVELIEGVVVSMSPNDPPHASPVELLTEM